MKGTRWSWRARLIAVAGLAVFAAAWTPWFRTAVNVGPVADPEYDITTATVWQASTWWSAAVLLSLATALAAAAAPQRAMPILARRPARWALVAGPVVALAVIVWQWRATPIVGPLRRWRDDLERDQRSGPYDGKDFRYIARDYLYILHTYNGVHYDVGWGLYAGLTAIAVLGVAIAVSALKTSPRFDRRIPQARR